MLLALAASILFAFVFANRVTEKTLVLSIVAPIGGQPCSAAAVPRFLLKISADRIGLCLIHDGLSWRWRENLARWISAAFCSTAISRLSLRRLVRQPEACVVNPILSTHVLAKRCAAFRKYAHPIDFDSTVGWKYAGG